MLAIGRMTKQLRLLRTYPTQLTRPMLTSGDRNSRKTTKCGETNIFHVFLKKEDELDTLTEHEEEEKEYNSFEDLFEEEED